MHEIATGIFWILLQFLGSGCFVTFDCKAQRVKCTCYIGMSDCLISDLERVFPKMFGDHGNLNWPGRPTKFRNNSINFTERSLTLDWEPPLDSSIRDVLGFFITVNGVDGLASGVHQCIVIQLNQSLNTTHYKTKFSVVYHPLFASSVYDFKIISLPTADLEYDPNEETLAAQVRIKTGNMMVENSPADWTTTMLCHTDGATITAMFYWPPERFKLSRIDVTISLLAENQSLIWENSSRISLTDNDFEQKQQLHWNYHDLDTSYKKIKIMIRPVERMRGLGQCTCHNANRLCVGGCRQSSCEVVIDQHQQESLAIRGSSEEDLQYRRLIPDHVIAALTSLSIVLFSVVFAVLLFVHRKRLIFRRSSQNPKNSNILPNNLDASEALTSPEITLPVNTSERQCCAFHSAGSCDDFIKPSSDLDEKSLTLSEQMLQINENYITTVLCTGSQMSLYAERISLGGKSV